MTLGEAGILPRETVTAICTVPCEVEVPRPQTMPPLADSLSTCFPFLYISFPLGLGVGSFPFLTLFF